MYYFILNFVGISLSITVIFYTLVKESVWILKNSFLSFQFQTLFYSYLMNLLLNDY